MRRPCCGARVRKRHLADISNLPDVRFAPEADGRSHSAFERGNSGFRATDFPPATPNSIMLSRYVAGCALPVNITS
jgi:hypothetical protein